MGSLVEPIAPARATAVLKMKGSILPIFLFVISGSLGLPGLFDQWTNWKPPIGGTSPPKRACVFCEDPYQDLWGPTECNYIEADINYYRLSKGLPGLRCHNVNRKIAELKAKDHEIAFQRGEEDKCGANYSLGFHDWKSEKYNCGIDCASTGNKNVLKCHLDRNIVTPIKRVWEISVTQADKAQLTSSCYLNIWKNSPGHEAAMT